MSVSPVFTRAGNLLFLDSDQKGLDGKRMLSIHNISDIDQYSIHIKEQEIIDPCSKSVEFDVFLKSQEKEIFLAPVKIKFKKNYLSEKQELQDLWIKSFNLVKLGEYKKANHQSFFKKVMWVVGGFFVIIILSLIAKILVGSTVQPVKYENGFQAEKQTNNIQTDDGRNLALKQLGLDPNSINFDNSCFGE